MKFSIRQAMAITLVVALSLQGCVELIEVLSLSDSRQTREHLEAKVRPLRQLTEISELVIADEEKGTGVDEEKGTRRKGDGGSFGKLPPSHFFDAKKRGRG